MSLFSAYEIAERVHDGDTSAVYRARRRADGQAVIIKLSKGGSASARQLTRFRNEYGLLSGLAVDGVVRTFGLLKHEGQLALIIEDAGATTLKQWLATGPRPLEAILGVGARLARILGDVHAAHIIHKDVNPQNVLYDADSGAVTLIDFDIATSLRSEGNRFCSPGELEGTLAYIAPEQTGRMNRMLDCRADLYALGITLYELLTGSVPHDSADALEMVHFHIAGRPTEPHARDPQIPQVLSDIVMKLLAKAPEDRYQSAIGVAHDLETCRERLRTRGEVGSFLICRHDVIERFEPPQKLYGREPEVRALLASFERVAKGGVEAVLVTGHAGIGKTALVQEIYEPVTRRRGYFAAGKFDQLRRDVPFSGLVSALNDLVQQLLTESEDSLAHWRDAIQAAVGPNGRLLLDVVPALEPIIGPQPEAATLEAMEAQNRFKLVFQSFVQVFCRKQNADDPHTPLVLFLDDMQWADPASLSLVTMMLSAPATASVLLVAAYRDEEVGPAHPLMLALEEQRRHGLHIQSVTLAALGIDDLAQLIGDAMHEPASAARPLAAVIRNKTGGNPFFVRQFLQMLYAEKLIAFDAGSQSFRYEVDRIEAASITENVAELLAHKLDKLPGFTRLALSLGAAIGNVFDLDTLAVVCERPADEVARALDAAIQDGLIAPASQLVSLEPDRLDSALVYERYAFLHDRIQQAAYAAIPATQRAALHLTVGRVLLMSVTTAAMDADIFDIVHHLNRGVEWIEEADERIRLAHLNLRAGRRAKNSTAYGPAAEFFRRALELLGANAWREHYEATCELHCALAECVSLMADFVGALALLDEAIAHARDDADVARLLTLRVAVCVLMGDMRAALECAGPAARMVGLPACQDAAGVAERLQDELEETLLRVSAMRIESALELPLMTDATMAAAMTTLVHVLPAAKQLQPDYFALIGCRLVNLSLAHGNTPVSARGYAAFAVVLSAMLGNHDDAHRFAKLGLDLNARFDDASMRAAVHFTFAAFVSAWTRPIAESIELYRRGIRFGLEAGDHAHVGFNAARCITHLQFAGTALAEVEAQALEYENLLERIGDRTNLGVLQPRIAFMRCLRGETADTATLNDAEFDEARCEAEIAAQGGRTVIADYLFVRLMHRSFFGDHAAALAFSRRLETELSSSVGYVTTAEACFHHSLALAVLHDGASPEERARHLAALERNQERMSRWMDANAASFAPMYLLVEAERARIRGVQREALALYDRAIAAAREAGFVHVEALACERAMLFWKAEGKSDFAGLYLERALQMYEAWGAHAKVRILSELVVQRASSRAYAVSTSRTYRSSTGTTSGSQSLDVAAVIKASQAISGEIVLDRLLATLMDIIVATAGAERGSLVLDSGGRMLVQARKTPDAVAPRVMESIALDEAAQLSPGILNYVIRTRQHVVLDDAAHTSRFRADPYVRREGVKSLLCAPIVHKGALKGALYLENNLVTAAFTPDRLEALNVLLSQVAVSIENATLYAELRRYRDHLEELVAERTRELKEAQQDLVDLSRRAGMAEIAAGVLHNVGNVMNSVNIGASVAREAVAELQVDAVLRVAELLGRNAQDLSAFLIQDDRGRKVPEYLGKLGGALAEKQRAILTNIDYMMEHLDHMKRIVSAQQSYAKSGGVVEGCSLAELVETALAINAVSVRDEHIEIVREIEPLPPVLLDRHGVLQILVNLVSNAKHALEERGGDAARVLRVAVRADGSRDVSIEVQDNGVGIAPEVIAKIFNHGFTTRRNGHGFGLHNSANAAQAMQGRLTAHSDGPGRGARFMLQLPARFADERGVARHA